MSGVPDVERRTAWVAHGAGKLNTAVDVYNYYHVKMTPIPKCIVDVEDISVTTIRTIRTVKIDGTIIKHDCSII